MKLSIVIPAYNEARTIHIILDKVLAVQLVNDITKEIVIVNDGSKDGTAEAVKSYMAAHPNHDIRFYEQPHNMGKAQPCIVVSKNQQAIILSYKMPT